MRTIALTLLLSACCGVETEGLTDLVPEDQQASVTCPDGQYGLPEGETVELPEGWRCASGTDGGKVFASCEQEGTHVRLYCEVAQGVETSVMQLGPCAVQVWCR